MTDTAGDDPRSVGRQPAARLGEEAGVAATDDWAAASWQRIPRLPIATESVTIAWTRSAFLVVGDEVGEASPPGVVAQLLTAPPLAPGC